MHKNLFALKFVRIRHDFHKLVNSPKNVFTLLSAYIYNLKRLQKF